MIHNISPFKCRRALRKKSRISVNLFESFLSADLGGSSK